MKNRLTKFASDYRAIPHPEVVSACTGACSYPSETSYGEDNDTREAITRLQNIFTKIPIDAILFVDNGSAANQVALDTLLGRPYESVICVKESHIDTAECGAIERLGYKLLPVPSKNGKLSVEQLDQFLVQRQDI